MISQISVLLVKDTTCNISTPTIAATSMICSQVWVTNMGDKCLDPYSEDFTRGKL